MKWGSRPVIVMGHGIRASGADPAPLLEMGVPVLSSWQAADLVDNFHPMYFGRPGIYGQRCANRILYEADQIVSIGCRLTPWMIGHGGLRDEQELVMVDVDAGEAGRFPKATWMNMDASRFIDWIAPERPKVPVWECRCNAWKSQYPWVEAAHNDANGYINSYRFMAYLQKMLRPAEIIVTDVGANMCPAFQVLKLKPPQRLMTSGGLGEMGCGLPAAIGASFATNRGEVILIAGDGGLLMNVQELQTIVHHRLPVKIIVFANDGYGMIKGTHKNLRFPYIGVDKASGVSMPDFHCLANGWGILARDINDWKDANIALPELFEHEGPGLVQVRIDPEQAYVPRLQPKIDADGKITPAKFHELSPLDA